MLSEMSKVYLKLQQNRNPLDIRKIFLMSREAKPWQSLHEGWRAQLAAIWFGVVNTLSMDYTSSHSPSQPSLL